MQLNTQHTPNSSEYYAVFEDPELGIVYFSDKEKPNCNFVGSIRGEAVCTAEFDSEEDAEKFVEKRRTLYEAVLNN